MSTYREILQEIIPDPAIAEAERRVYQNTRPRDSYWCNDGMCALGVMLQAYTTSTRRFPTPCNFDGAYEDVSPTVRRRRYALTTVMRANDHGLLATPGSLTALLDRPCKAVIA